MHTIIPIEMGKTDQNSVLVGKTWSVYLVRCRDGSLYAGVAIDIPGRVQQHNKGMGAKYTRGRGPVELVYSEEVGEQGAALRREYAIKQLSKAEKLQLISSCQCLGRV